MVDIKFNEKTITLVNIYAPNNENDRSDFFKKLNIWINKHAKNLENIVLCGNFNCQTEHERNDKSVNILKKIMKNFSFKDSWAYLDKKPEEGLTWRDGSNVP